MTIKHISATEAARNFSDVLNQVHYRDTSFAITRGQNVVAKLMPITKQGISLSELEDLMRRLPALGEQEVKTWHKSIRLLRNKQKAQIRSWG